MTRIKLLPVLAFITILFSLNIQFNHADILDPSEVLALNNIKKTLLDPLNKLENWGTGDPCNTNWTGVICYNRTLFDGYLHVQELQLLKMNLSGTLSPWLGNLTYMMIMDFMWNNMTGSIPDEVGNITSLELLLLNGNKLTGSLPDSIGFLPNLNRIQIDQNRISGPVPKSFANLNKTKHFHMNNNSLSGQIPHELSRLPILVHLLLDNNNLSGFIPEELSQMPSINIIQLDNNNFSGTSIPASFSNMTKLFKMSLRNCSLQGSIPDLSAISQLGYLDLSWNQLTGPIPTNKLSSNITTIDLSNNLLNETIPSNFSGLPNLQILSLENNDLTGTVPSNIWQGVTISGNRSLILDFQNNSLTNISGSLNPPANVTIMLFGNPVCTSANQLGITNYCGVQTINIPDSSRTASSGTCGPCPNDLDYEINPLSPFSCFCSVPFSVGYRLKSPGFTNFIPYEDSFASYLTSGLTIALDQLNIESFIWEEGPRLKMNLKFFPNGNISNKFSEKELERIKGMFTGWLIPDSDIFGPYELLNFTEGSYQYVYQNAKKSGLSTGAIVGIVLAAFAGAAILSTVITILIMKRNSKYRQVAKRRTVSRIKVDGVKSFTFAELAAATNDFDSAAQVGQGGYGKVYKGVLADGTVAAIKRAQQGSLQGSKEFFTEIELLSRLHHRNLVGLLGYCDEEEEQMLVYEFMPNGTLRDHLSGKFKESLSFSSRLRLALAAARGISYLHTEADPPIFHRDIKASNILLDAKMVAKVADFGLSRLAELPLIEGNAPGQISTVVKGTPGYLDPEYFLTHKLTDKSDVYSLGVVFLELLTGRQPITYGRNIVREVMMASQSGHIFSVIDDRMGSYPAECVEKFATLALRCCKDETDERPSMKEVVRELEVIWRLMPDAEFTPSDSLADGKRGEGGSSSASSMGRGHHVFVSSTDVSGSNLLSGAMPNITPR